MGKRLHVVKKQREYGSTEAFNWCFDKFRDLIDNLGCNTCSEDEYSDFWELTKEEYKRAINILKLMKDVPFKGNYSEQAKKIDQIIASEKYQKLFSANYDDDCSITAEDIDLYDVVKSLNDLDIELNELISIMNGFLKEADKKSDWIQFEAW
jgi:lipid II:glycine glycyltransferase (peptidoglycan interpeptide bridge formation enzyme)